MVESNTARRQPGRGKVWEVIGDRAEKFKVGGGK